MGMKPFINHFFVVYLDDILIFSHSREEHLTHLEMVLKKLKEKVLRINLDKCDFMKEELVFLGFVISKGNPKMDLAKLEAILNRPTPRNSSEVKSFHGLAYFYRKFIKGFSNVCAPMIDTIKGGRKCKFAWTKDVD